MSRSATLYPGKRCLTEIVGIELVTAEEAATLASLGFSTVEMTEGTWLGSTIANQNTLHGCPSEEIDEKIPAKD